MVGGGPSVKLVQSHFEEARQTAQGLRWIAVNNAYQLIPWADVLYACDAKWWKQHNGAKHFRGLKITQATGIAKIWPEVKKIFCRKGYDHLLFDAPGEVGWSGNSGFHALNLAIQFGAKRVVLIGYDMSIDHGHHWHGRHPKGLNNPSQKTTDGWRIKLDAQRPLLDRMGISVVIGSPDSRLAAYPKLGFIDAIAGGENSRQSSPG